MRQALGQLTSAIQSGNLSAAQSAYSTLAQTAGSNPNDPFAQALAQIGDDLQLGNITQAQQDLATLQQQMKGAHRHHGHHHHAGGAGLVHQLGRRDGLSGRVRYDHSAHRTG